MTSAAKPLPQDRPDVAQGLSLHEQGQLDRAEEIYSAVLAAEPDHCDAQHLLGVLRHQQGRNVDALRLIGAALIAAPRSADVVSNYGRVLAALSRHEEALARFEQALALNADHLHALSNRADTLAHLNRDDAALAAYARLLALKPEHPATLNKCAGLNVRMGRIDAAIGLYDRALKIEPRRAELHINKGKAYRAANRFAEALACFEQAAAIEPGSVEAHWNAGLVRLRLGDFKRGWQDYEWRWRKADWAGLERNFSAPLWRGDAPLAGKTILIHAEQGLGDTIQFVRYAPLLARHGASVVLECQPELAALLRGVDGIANTVARGAMLPPFHCHCPLLSLPLACGTELGTIPNDMPYVSAPEASSRLWAERLAELRQPRIGIVWAGNPAHFNDRNRSLAVRDLAPVLSVAGVQFVALQKSISPPDLAALAQFSNVLCLHEELHDFSDTASIIAQLDRVIAVDTAVAHLAGAMGKPVDLFVPFSSDWRWLIDRTDSPWYPTMRLFRQSVIGDWLGPVEAVRQALAHFVTTRG